MADASSFAAEPQKRLSAALVDFVLIGLAALLVYAAADALQRRPQFEVLLPIVAFIYHGAFLSLWAGQSPGRRVFDLTVVSAEGADLRAWQALVRSAARPAAVMAAATAAPAFQTSRVDFGAQVACGIVLLEIGLMFITASRRTAVDFLSGTLVVNTPPPQPHRAPAAPMYSASDAEFGYSPRRPGSRK